MTSLSCTACGAALPAGSRFCSRCGVPSGSRAAVSRRLSPWLAAVGAAAAVLLGLGLVVWRGGAVRRVAAAPPAASVPAAMPDISQMTPRERFDRLYARVMQGLRAGDTLALSRFAPMALGAFEMLDSASADSTARRQAALLRLHLGDTSVVWPPRRR